jgi:SPP1 gp7 family putative phage head morphogenesis protein
MRPFPFPIPDSITPDAYKAMVLQLQPDEGDESDAEQQIRMEIERQFAAELEPALRDQMNDLIPPTATDAMVRAAPGNVAATSEQVRTVLRRHLQQGAELGVSVAFDQMNTIGMAFDWSLVHTRAAQWASRYSYDLIQGMNQTTQAQLQIAVDEWFKDATSLGALRQQLAPTFGGKRAQLIAQTETTRAAYQGSVDSYRQSGVVSEVEFVTVNDEKVCSLCGPLDGERAPLGGTFPGGYTIPVHVNCRCFCRPVLE